jgi:uncharacterized protein YhaN
LQHLHACFLAHHRFLGLASGRLCLFMNVLGRYPEWAETSPDADALRAGALLIRREFVRDVEAAEDVHKQAQSAAGEAEKTVVGQEAGMQMLQEQVAAIRPKIEVLCNDGKDDAQREAELNRLALAWTAAKALRQQAEEQLRELGDDPSREAGILEQQLRHLQNAVVDFDNRFHGEQGRLQSLANDAPYSALAEEEETIAGLEAALTRERLSYAAIRLLYDRVQLHRKSLNREILGPVTNRATAMLQRVAGRKLGSVQLGTDFLPSAVTPEAAGDEVKIDELCGGEKEQIYLAVRLALADVLYRKQRDLVVLDDALTYTDSGRFARVLGILDEAAVRFQILVLTCHPERYTGLSGACFIDLEKQ